MAIRVAPAHSPPTARPCSVRSTTIRMGAATPIFWAEGIRPMATDTTPIVIRVMIRTFLRPNLSPK